MATQTNMTKRNSDSQLEGLEGRPQIPPPVDIYENVDEILVRADVPGAGSDDITIRLEANQLFVHARRQHETKGEAVLPTFSADYARTFLVPRGLDAERISAELKDGVLEIHLPKSASAKPRKIAVRAH
jgi:HSP20 family protein